MTISKTILVAPLNWGLGHATRCVPIIKQLLGLNHTVILASDGMALELLKQEFPDLEHIELPSYHITYPSTGSFAFHMLKKVPGILKSIEAEHQFVQHLIKHRDIDLIISDHRYGMYHADVTSVFIAHQIKVLSPIGETILAQLHQRFLNKFDSVWVPDSEGMVNLSGKLSHQTPLHKNTHFIGALSRFTSPLAIKVPDQFPENTPFILALVSGPEPQRSLFESLLLKELSQNNSLVLIVGGNPNGTSAVSKNNIIHYPFLGSSEIKWAIENAQMVICRSGYSTVMDLIALEKPAVFVPTPGQTEQEYLAEYLSKYSMFDHISQKHFNWKISQKKGANLATDKYLMEKIKSTPLNMADLLMLLQN